MMNHFFEELSHQGKEQQKDKLSVRDELYRMAFETNSNPMCFFDPDTGAFLEVNQAAINHYDYSREELLQMRLWDLHRSLDLSLLHQINKSLINGEQHLEKWQDYKKNGSVIDIDVTLSALLVEGKLLNLMVIRDIPKQTEILLRQYEEQNRLALELTGTASWKWDLVTGELIWSDNLFNLLGLNRQEVSPSYTNWRDCVHPEDIERLEAAVSFALSNRQLYNEQYRIIHPDGNIHWLLSKGHSVYNATGQAVQMVGITLDISDRKITEIALDEVSQKFSSFVNSATFNIAMFDRNMKYIAVSQSWVNTYQLGSIEAVIGQSDYELFPNLPESWRQVHQQALAGNTIKADEDSFIMADGSIQWSKWEIQPWRLNTGEVGGIIIFVEDITKRKQTEQIIHIQVQQEALVRQVTARIRQSLDIQTIFITASEEIRQFLQADRVCIFKFYPESNFNDGEVVAESVLEEFSSAMAVPVHDHCFGENYSSLYANGRILVVDDIYNHGLTDCHRDILARFQVQASLVIPLLHGENLWGLLCIHQCSSIRHWQQSEINLTQQIANQLAIAIQQANLYDKIQKDIIHRQDTEKKLQGLTNRLSLALKSGAIGCWEWDIESNKLTWDEQMFKVYGLAINLDIDYNVWANALHPDDRLSTEICLQSALLGKQEYEPEFRIVRPDGNIRFIKAYGLVIKDNQGNPKSMIGVNFDITEQKEDQATIAFQLQQQEILGAIVQSIRDSLNIQEILKIVTEQTKNVLNSDRVIVFQLFPDGRSQIVEEAVSIMLPKLKDLFWENEVWHQDILEYYWQGKPRIVPDVMDDIWTDCLIPYSLIGQIKSKIVAPILQEVKAPITTRWVASSGTNKLWGVLVVHACQEKRQWQESEAELLQQIANQLAIAIKQANLFEQLHQEQQQLKETNQQLALSNQEIVRATRLKDEFLANMSHELRTPLNAILGMTEGLQDDIFGLVNEQQLQALSTVEKSASHLLSLIDDILDVAKIEAGQSELDITSVAVTTLCSSSIAFIKEQCVKKRIQLETIISPGLPNLLVDERRIRQVLINLLTNAVKFTLENGKIILAVSQLPEGNYLRISVIDTGIGIALENIKKLFQPFVQIDSTLSRQYTGTGLGLALVKQIVELHGGQVGLTSQLGVGSCFTIDLPCVELATPLKEMVVKTQESELAPQTTGSNINHLILLADDNEDNLLATQSYLKAMGYNFIIAKNGQEAVALARLEQPDLIIMDVQMPRMDGLKAIRQIRSDANLVNVPIIALTALAMVGDRERCLEAGANEYLSKPVKLKNLASVMQKLLQQITIK